ncbi:MAG: hypothetical protein KJ709_09115 [Nanoarchaeota archaeon]|nr:hypothetical protein [Nanoarchaeota archaeon]
MTYILHLLSDQEPATIIKRLSKNESPFKYLCDQNRFEHKENPTICISVHRWSPVLEDRWGFKGQYPDLATLVTFSDHSSLVPGTSSHLYREAYREAVKQALGEMRLADQKWNLLEEEPEELSH